MACSKYEYVKMFEECSSALLQTYIVVRVDGRAFTKFCAAHQFTKPNDIRAINLMNLAAEYVCNNFTQIFLAYGQSDEYSFVFNKNTTLFSRRTDKILSCLVSAFTSAYVFNWKKFFDIELRQIPTFDSRVIIYPNETVLKDYFRWRQVDCHINNLYNTVFWAMVKSGKSNQEVQKILKDTDSGKKNEILFTQYNINYNNIEQIYRRGTLLYYILSKQEQPQKQVKQQQKQQVIQKNTQKVQKIINQPIHEPQINEEQKKQQLILKNQQKNECRQQKSKEKTNMGEKAQKIRRKLVVSHQDCIKEEFWKKFFN